MSLSIGCWILLGLLASMPVAGWNVDSRCTRRHLDSAPMDETFLDEEAEIMHAISVPTADKMNMRRLRARELQSTASTGSYSFNMKLYWEPGYCWQSEWDQQGDARGTAFW